jgi:outer membrane protein OmpA-like peptidoglycan-associated protein
MEMRKILYMICFFALFFIPDQSDGQILSKANKYFNSFAYDDAAKLYENLWKKDSLDTYLTRQLAISYRMLNNTDKAEIYYSKLMKMSDVKAEDYYHYARALQSNEKYKEAKTYMEKYVALENEYYEIDPNYILSLKEDSLRYHIEPVSINSKASDFGPAFYTNQLVFSSSKVRNNVIERSYRWNVQSYFNLYVTNINDDGDLEGEELLLHKFGTSYHDGPVCFNQAGDEMFLTRNYVSDSRKAKKDKIEVVSIKLYYCKKEGDHWSSPELLPFNLEGHSTGHPSLSSDGQRLFFISDRPGGMGGTDIYYVDRKDGIWSEPVNVGRNINTSEDEMFPFIADNNSLYFSSKGHAGLGGLDIFWIQDLESGIAVNMGYPINTSKDDFSFILKKGKGYLASNRVRGETYDDIYQFEILEFKIKGKVYAEDSKQILANTLVKLIDEKGSVKKEMLTGDNGSFRFVVSDIQNYKLISEKEKFHKVITEVPLSELENQIETNCIILQLKESKMDLVEVDSSGEEKMLETSVDVGLVKINTNEMEEKKSSIEKLVDKKKEDQKVSVFVTIFYDVDKVEISDNAVLELDRLVMMMNDNPSIKLELNSHTDSRGSDAYNMALSERRAETAVKYIISHGISEGRITIKAHGERKLINHCANDVECSEEEHQANRRTEIKILKLFSPKSQNNRRFTD